MKKFFSKIWAFLKMLFTNPDQWINDNVLPAIATVKYIKKIVDSPSSQVVTALIPGEIDDKIKEKLSIHLSTVINIISAISGVSDSEKNEAFINWLKTLTPSARSAIYAKTASKLAQLYSGQEVKNNASDLITQLVYSKEKSGVNEDDLKVDTLYLPPTVL